MAKGVELASAYISLSVSTDGIPREIEKALGSARTGAGKHGDAAGRAFSQKFGEAVKKGAGRHAADAGQAFSGRFNSALSQGFTSSGFTRHFANLKREAQSSGSAAGFLAGRAMGAAMNAAIAAAAATAAATIGTIGLAMHKGFQRYKSLDKSTKRLAAFGKTAGDIKRILSDINDVVDGTPIALDEATDAATKFITAGTEGQELKETLLAIANAAGVSGENFNVLATIFNQVNNKGKLFSEELQQLAEHGLNVFPALEKQFGKLPENVADAGLTIRDLVKAINSEWGGMAKSAADTIDGAMSQLNTSLARLGANIISTVFGDPTEAVDGPTSIANAINSVTTQFDKLSGWISANREDVVGFFANVAMASVTMAQVVTESAAWVIRGLGWIVNAAGDALGGVTRAVAWVNRALGRDEIADGLEKNAESFFAWGDGILDVANQASDAADKLNEMFFSIGDWKSDSQTAIKFTRELGKAIAEVNEKDVILKAPTKEDLAQIDKAKWAIIEIPDSKDVIIRPRTREATDEINAWREKQGAEPVVFFADANMEPASDTAEAWRRVQEKQPTNIPIGADVSPAAKELEDWQKLILGKPLQVPVQIIGPSTGSPVLDWLQSSAVGTPIPSSQMPSTGNPVLDQMIGPAATGPTNAPQQLPKQGHAGSSYVTPSPLIGDAAAAPAAASTTGALNWSTIDQLAQSLGLTMTSGTRPGDKGYHGVGMARDYAGPPAAMQKFAAILAQRFGGQLKELIHDAPGWASNIKNGKVVGPFGAFYTMNQAGRHDDHVHVAFGSGGAVHGPGGPTADRIPAWLSDGEHVLSARDVQAMGGQAGVYAFRNALHRAKGGSIEHELWKMDRDKVPWFVPGNRQPWSDIPRVGIQAGSEYRTSGPIWDQGPIWEWWMFPGPGQKLAPGSRERQNRRGINWGPYNPRWDPGLDPGLPGLGPGKHGPGGSFEQELRRRLGFAEGGAVVLEELLALAGQQNPNPATTQHGQGALPGPTQEQLQQIAERLSPEEREQLQQGMIPQQQDPLRTEGYIPAGASFTGKTGGGLLGGVINLGASAIKGVIDQAAQAASSAVGAAVAGASMGTAAPAAPAGAAAAQAAIGLGAEAAKRAVDYGAEMANIGIGAVTEILSPFGAPRWMSDLDPTAFIPRWDISDALTTTAEQQRQQPGQQPGEPMSPEPHQGTGAPPGPGATPGDPQATPGSVPPPTVAPSVAPGSPPPVQNNAFDFIKQITGGVYDQGGVLQPGTAAINLSNRPEYVFNASQWKTLENMASQNMMSGGGATYNVYATDVETALRELRKQERRNSRQYSGRP